MIQWGTTPYLNIIDKIMGTQMCNTYSRGFVCLDNAIFYIKYQPNLLFYVSHVEYVQAILIYH